MKTHYIEQNFTYDGSQLKSLFAYMKYGVLGDSIVAWQGPCDVSFAHMLDGEDLRAQSPIRGDHMLHFIVEKFEVPLFAAVALQRLLTTIAADEVRAALQHNASKREPRREGDDIYIDDKKLSISIATVSPVSALVHFAVNVKNSGTPVPTIALEDLAVKPVAFAKQIMKRFADEVDSIEEAVRKVRPAGSH